jgi:CrcB protein
MKQILLVGLGGAAGSMLRYLTTILTARYFPVQFPLGTFVVNITGCFLIGLLMGGLADQHNPQLRLLLITGFCGGYTTFSAFSYENMVLLNSNHSLMAIGYIFASVVFGLAAVWLGLKIM